MKVVLLHRIASAAYVILLVVVFIWRQEKIRLFGWSLGILLVGRVSLGDQPLVSVV